MVRKSLYITAGGLGVCGCLLLAFVSLGYALPGGKSVGAAAGVGQEELRQTPPATVATHRVAGRLVSTAARRPKGASTGFTSAKSPAKVRPSTRAEMGEGG